MSAPKLLIDQLREARRTKSMMHHLLYQLRSRKPSLKTEIEILHDSTESAIQIAMGAQVVLIDEAAKVVDRKLHAEQIDIDDFPCLIPPFPVTWLEYEDYSDTSSSRAGVLCTAYDLRRKDWSARRFLVGQFTHVGAGRAEPDHPMTQFLRQEETAWLVVLFPFFHSTTLNRVCGAWMTFWLVLDEMGRSRGPVFPLFQPFAQATTDLSTKEAQMILLSDYDAVWATACTALALLHCKNVRSPETKPDPMVERHQRIMGKPPTTIYKTLVIDAPGGKRRPGKPQSTTSPRRLSIVRGHFAHYGVEWQGKVKGKYFGKHTGIYFIPDHVRGSIDAGLVVKDYQLGAESGS